MVSRTDSNVSFWLKALHLFKCFMTEIHKCPITRYNLLHRAVQNLDVSGPWSGFSLTVFLNLSPPAAPQQLPISWTSLIFLLECPPAKVTVPYRHLTIHSRHTIIPTSRVRTHQLMALCTHLTKTSGMPPLQAVQSSILASILCRMSTTFSLETHAWYRGKETFIKWPQDHCFLKLELTFLHRVCKINTSILNT